MLNPKFLAGGYVESDTRATRVGISAIGHLTREGWL